MINSVAASHSRSICAVPSSKVKGIAAKIKDAITDTDRREKND